MEGISITKLLVVGILIVLLFGTSKLRTLGADLGAALKGFKKAMGNDDAPPTNTAVESKVATEAKPPIEHKD
ncbi:TPA: Sec-independent protein translocase subunit TatA [Yersinia enterocolitica]